MQALYFKSFRRPPKTEKILRLYVLISHITYHLKRKPCGSNLICDAATNKEHLTLLVRCQDGTYIFPIRKQ